MGRATKTHVAEKPRSRTRAQRDFCAAVLPVRPPLGSSTAHTAAGTTTVDVKPKWSYMSSSKEAWAGRKHGAVS